MKCESCKGHIRKDEEGYEGCDDCIVDCGILKKNYFMK